MYSFQEFNKTILDATKDNWLTQIDCAEGELLVTHYYRMLDWAEKHVNGGSSDNSYVYALAKNETPSIAIAILDISHARPNSNEPWLKVLGITLEPRLDLVENPAISELAEIAAAAITESLGLTFNDYPSTQLKIYGGSSPLTKDFLEGLAARMVGTLDVQIEGHRNWLVINKNN